eukprot:9213149-Pyramimonas_sp.AAC.1
MYCDTWRLGRPNVRYPLGAHICEIMCQVRTRQTHVRIHQPTQRLPCGPRAEGPTVAESPGHTPLPRKSMPVFVLTPGSLHDVGPPEIYLFAGR